MELWDAYDRFGHQIPGVTLVRDAPIPAGYFHLVSDVLVQHEDGTVLLMQRHPAKVFGGYWEATAGGSALQGEDARTCALRELQEETGILVEELEHVGTEIRQNTIYEEFFCRTDWKKGRIYLREGETVAYRWVPAEEFRDMHPSELVTYRIQKYIEGVNR